MKNFCILLCLMLFAGCGHNFYFESENIGIALRIPLPEGGDIGLMAGSTKTVSASVRGGSSFTTESAHGAGLLSDHGVAKVTQFKSNIQVNEGNIERILTSSNITEKVKLEFVKNLDLKSKAPEFKSNVLQTRSALIGSHDANLKGVKPLAPTGVDKIVENVTETIAATTEAITDNVVPQPGKTIVATVENIRKSISNIVTLAIVLIVASTVLLFIKGKKKKKKKKNDVNLEEDETVPDMIQPPESVEDIKTEGDTESAPFVETPSKPKKKTMRFLLWAGMAAFLVGVWKFLLISSKVSIARSLATMAYKMRHLLKKKKKKSEDEDEE